MKFHNNNQMKSKTIENKSDQHSFKKNNNKFSKSQASSNILSNEIFNKKHLFNKQMINNNSNSSSSKDNELYDEEINYNIDSTKNIHDTTNFTNLIKDKKKDNTNIFNTDEITDKNLGQKEYWLEEKNSYIQELEKKIKKQNNIINGLLNNESSSKSKNTNTKDNNEKSSNNIITSYLDYKYENKKLSKKFNKKEPKNRTFIGELTSNDSSVNNTNNSYMNNNRTNMSYNIYKPKDKYDTLYSKYLNLLNDFKYLNNNKSNEKSVNKIKKKYNSLLEENKNLKSKLKSKNKIIKNQQKEISDIKELYSKRQSNINNEEEKEIIKNLREESETFRKDLVLSQAMVNSLKAEIEALKKSNNTSKIIKNANKRNQTMNKNNNLFDKYNFTFNNNHNQNSSISPKNNLRIINDTIEDNFNNYSTKDLINSLNNKNKLLTKVLQENNLLRKKLKKFDSFLPNFVKLYDYDEMEEENQEKLKDNLIQKYEEKFQYFSYYLKRIKILINDIFKDIPFSLNKYLNKNNALSEKFILGLYELRKEYYTIKKIDEFNLDITDDEKCIKIYMNLNKLLNRELELFNNTNNNMNIYDNDNTNAISKITNISNNNISNNNSNFNSYNNYRFLEKDINNENDIKYINDYNNQKRLNLTDLNIGRIEEEKNNNPNLNKSVKNFQLINDETLNKKNDRRITYVTNYKKINNKKSNSINYNREYFFDYGINSNNDLVIK